jgi:small subunit ribosomal protein S17
MAEAPSATEARQVRHHQEKVGMVTSSKMQKTIVVEVRRRVAHPMYKRIVTKRSRFMAHDEHGKAREGDMVRIVEARPLSKNKRWVLKEVVRAAAIVASPAQVSAATAPKA